jgi:antitoxin component YwqK of YwqJK toxin-antitoxin module
MVLKELLLNKKKYFSCFLGLLLSLGCAEKKEVEVTSNFSEVDVSQIPMDTVSSVDSGLRLNNGIYYYNNKPFSGFTKEVYGNGSLKSVGSYYQGMQHGITKTFYLNGSIRDSRSYKENIGYGRHYGYWENGNMKFDFTYYFDKREGIQKQWYESGSAYAFLNFKADREHGLQQAWRENGKPYINYEAKDGFRYGLQKSSLCYTLEDEKVKSRVLKEVALKK